VIVLEKAPVLMPMALTADLIPRLLISNASPTPFAEKRTICADSDDPEIPPYDVMSALLLGRHRKIRSDASSAGNVAVRARNAVGNGDRESLDTARVVTTITARRSMPFQSTAWKDRVWKIGSRE
jgi:hypothetical protein